MVLGGVFIWTTYSEFAGSRSALLDSYFFTLGALYLFDGAILLFSKPFAVEFARLRTAQSQATQAKAARALTASALERA